MQTALRITFRDMDPSDFVERHVRAEAESLEEHTPNITSCHVTIALPHRHRHGSHPHVSIELAMPGKQLVVNRDHHEKKELTDVHACIDSAFACARRMVGEHVESQRMTRR